VGPHRVGAQAACVSTFGLACARTAPNAVATITGLDRSDGFAWDTYEEFAVPLDTVRANFARYGLLDEQVRFLAGWFKDTLPAAPFSQLAVVRLDGDLYESTWDAMTSLYPRLSPGGFLIVDDYKLPACAKAIQNYRDVHGITDRMNPIDAGAIFWRKS